MYIVMTSGTWYISDNTGRRPLEWVSVVHRSVSARKCFARLSVWSEKRSDLIKKLGPERWTGLMIILKSGGRHLNDLNHNPSSSWHCTMTTLCTNITTPAVASHRRSHLLFLHTCTPLWRQISTEYHRTLCVKNLLMTRTYPFLASPIKHYQATDTDRVSGMVHILRSPLFNHLGITYI